MAAYTPIDYLADQLRTAAPGREWDASGVDRARELAQMLYTRKGVRDLSKLSLTRIEVVDKPFPWSTPETTYHFALKYDNGPYWGYIGTNDRVDNMSILEGNTEDILVAWSSAGHGNVRYRIEPAPNGPGFIIAPVWGSSSDAALIRQSLIMFASIYLAGFAMAGVGAGAFIGSQIMGAEIAAAYPSLTAAVGNVAISTAMNGGDIESAVKNAALSAAGANLGAAVSGLVLDATGLDALAKVSAAAASAYVRGGNVGMAVTSALLQFGASSLQDVLQPQAQPVSLFTPDSAPPDSAPPDLTPAPAQPGINPMEISQTTYDMPISLDPGSVNGGLFTQFNTYSNSGDPYNPDPTYTPAADPTSVFTFQPFNPDSAAPVISPGGTGFQTASPPIATLISNTIIGGNLFPTSPIVSPIPSAVAAPPADFSMSNLTQGVTAAAMAALQIYGAYKNVTQNNINPNARVVNTNGSVSVVSANGTIQTRNANGTVTSAPLPVKQPAVDPNGNIVVNNGNGTYTVVTPQGQTQTASYPAGTTSSFSLSTLTQNPMLLYGGAAVLALLLLRR